MPSSLCYVWSQAFPTSSMNESLQNETSRHSNRPISTFRLLSNGFCTHIQKTRVYAAHLTAMRSSQSHGHVSYFNCTQHNTEALRRKHSNTRSSFDWELSNFNTTTASPSRCRTSGQDTISNLKNILGLALVHFIVYLKSCPTSLWTANDKWDIRFVSNWLSKLLTNRHFSSTV